MKLDAIDFTIATLEDELRVDGLCRNLLLAFYNEQLATGTDEHDATLLANSADYFLRDYLVGYRQMNLLEEIPGMVRQFAGNWYIVNTLEPTADELAGHLKGIREFYHFLARNEGIGCSFLAEIDRECFDLEYYSRRINGFWTIMDDGYYEWERECSMKN